MFCSSGLNVTPVPLRWDWQRLMTRDRRDFGVFNVIFLFGVISHNLRPKGGQNAARKTKPPPPTAGASTGTYSYLLVSRGDDIRHQPIVGGHATSALPSSHLACRNCPSPEFLSALGAKCDATNISRCGKQAFVCQSSAMLPRPARYG